MEKITMEKINYDKSHEWMADSRYVEEFISLADLNKSHYVLDAGCGSGYVAAAIRPKVRDLLQIDHDWAMLSRNNLAHHTETLKADLLNLWMLKGSNFDFIFCRSVLHRLREPEKAYMEFKRLLKPGGKLVVSVSYSPDSLKGEYLKIMGNKGFRLYLTYKKWRDFFTKGKDRKLIKDGKIFFKLDLNHWGLLKEHENASKEFREYFKLSNGIIECSHAYFVLEKNR